MNEIKDNTSVNKNEKERNFNIIEVDSKDNIRNEVLKLFKRVSNKKIGYIALKLTNFTEKKYPNRDLYIVVQCSRTHIDVFDNVVFDYQKHQVTFSLDSTGIDKVTCYVSSLMLAETLVDYCQLRLAKEHNIELGMYVSVLARGSNDVLGKGVISSPHVCLSEKQRHSAEHCYRIAILDTHQTKSTNISSDFPIFINHREITVIPSIML